MTDNSKLKRAIDRVIREFERRFGEDARYRIEDLLDADFEAVVQPFDIDPADPKIRDAILAELIHVEMNLRCVAGEVITPEEYIHRFIEARNFELTASIQQAVQWNREHFPNSFTETVEHADNHSSSDLISDDSAFEVRQPENQKDNIPSELGPYHKITYIGEGGFGLVYRAVDIRNNEEVALKFPKQKKNSPTDVMQLLKDEAELAMRLDHPNIVATRAIENIGGRLFIVQDFIDGTSLTKSRRQKNQHETALTIAMVADALAYAHREGILHRDIKPGNILVDSQGKPYVADFGLAIHTSHLYGTIGQPVCGTKQYLPPEVVSGRQWQIGGANDVWSLGIVFYQLLVRKRPFGGPDTGILFGEIKQRDPEKLHVIDPEIDSDLEQICMQCLEKRPGHRLTARQLADQLQRWLKIPAQPPKKAKFVPRGLHSYTAKDAPFFLRLLPGPQDENDIPASIRFWRNRILEPVAQEDRVPVGVIYGPSGCGKSSFVKAGLIPQLDDQVSCIYIESTYADTDVRLIKALKAEFKEIPAGQLSLPDIFAGLRQGKWPTKRKKILIVLDQFEQRLSAVKDFDPTNLIQAMKQCDGEILQCLLLVRDDFLLSMARFADALDMDLREGRNTQIIDLFDRKHAQEILTMLGFAYKRLSTESFEELTGDEQTFVDNAVDEYLIHDQHVICVRLTVFAELLKPEPWTLTNLRSLGGVSGVGQRFLETTFASKKYRDQKERAQLVLAELLPAAGTDIRGSMKSSDELQVAAGLQNQPGNFKSLIRTLENNIGLIAQSDPDAVGAEPIEKIGDPEKPRFYQLTHDYLVESIRDWLNSELEKTWRGRRKIRFESLARRYTGKWDREILPSLFEYGTFAVAIPQVTRKQASPFWEDASKKALHHLSALAVVLAVIFVVGLLGYNAYNNERAQDLYSAALDCEPDAFPLSVERLAVYSSRVPSTETARTSTLNSRKRLHDCLIRQSLHPFAKSNLEDLVALIPEASAKECNNVVSSLQKTNRTNLPVVIDFLAERIDYETDSQTRNRLSIVLLFLGDERAADKIVNSPNASHRSDWIDEFTRWKPSFLEQSKTLMSLSSDEVKAALCIAVGIAAPTIDNELEKEVIDSWLGRISSQCPSPEIHSASKWALQRITEKPSFFGPPQYPLHRKWFVDEVGLSFARIDGFDFQDDIGDSGTLFVSDTEIPVFLFEEFLKDINTALSLMHLQIPNMINKTISSKPNSPAQNVSVEHVILFCNWLSFKNNREPCYHYLNGVWNVNPSTNGFRISTHREAKHYFRYGPDCDFHFGDDTDLRHISNYITCIYNSTTRFDSTSDCGTRAPNRFGLFDTFGNVNEWCWNNEQFQLSNSPMVYIGGHFASDYDFLLLEPAKDWSPNQPFYFIGFRVVTKSAVPAFEH